MTAADLTFVGVSEDGHHLLLADESGAQFRLRLDATLCAATRRVPAVAQRQDATAGHPSMSPREVQALIRAGASADEVVELSGWPREKIEKYEGPIVAEREFVASLATQVRLRSLTGSTLLSTRVAERLAQRDVDPAVASWDAWRAAGRPWTLQLSFPAGGRLREARWTFDLQTRAVTPEDDEARWLCADEDPRPAPFVPVGPRTTVYDVDADGGLEPPHRPSPAVPSRPARPVVAEATADLGPERPRTAAHRHDGDQDADLENSMRSRSAANRRRGGRTMARPTPTSRSQEVVPEPVVPPAAEPQRATSPQGRSAPQRDPMPQPDPMPRRPTRAVRRGPERGAATDMPLDAASSRSAPSNEETQVLADIPAPPAPAVTMPRDHVDHPAVETEHPVAELADPAPEIVVAEPVAVPEAVAAEDGDVSPDDALDVGSIGDSITTRNAPTTDVAAQGTEVIDAEAIDAEASDAGVEVAQTVAPTPTSPPVGDAGDGPVATGPGAVVSGAPGEGTSETLEPGTDAGCTGPQGSAVPETAMASADDIASPTTADGEARGEPASIEHAAPSPASDEGVADGTGDATATTAHHETAEADRSQDTTNDTASQRPSPRQRQQPSRKKSAASRKGRAAVPAWDDIMFGTKRD